MPARPLRGCRPGRCDRTGQRSHPHATAYLPLSELVDLAAERERIAKELEKAQNGLRIVEQKLSNEKFVSRAPEAVSTPKRRRLPSIKS